MPIKFGAATPLQPKISLTGLPFRTPSIHIPECPDPWCELGTLCPISSCQGVLEPRNKSGHWHSHIQEGYWHNVKRALMGNGVLVTQVCDWNRSDRRAIPSGELLQNAGLAAVDISNHARFLTWVEAYLWDLVMQPLVQTFLQQNGSPGVVPFKLPRVEIAPTCGSDVGGMATGDSLIEISSWILADRDQTALVVRHELAHIIVARCNLKDPDHGPWFSAACQAISPLTWESDRHWTTTPAIEKAKLAHHPKATRLITPAAC